MNPYANVDYIINTIIIGNSGVGKTSILQQLVNTNNVFSTTEGSTIGVDFYKLVTKIKNKTYKIQLWDTGGQERFQSIVNSFYKNIAICYIVYSVTDINSFNQVSIIFDNFKNISTNKNTIFVLIGNKIDDYKNRVVTVNDGQILANSYNMIFIEISCKNKMGLDDIILEPMHKLIKLIKTNRILLDINNGIKVNNINNITNLEEVPLLHNESEKTAITKTKTKVANNKYCCNIL
jgi:small GTP-binding protein